MTNMHENVVDKDLSAAIKARRKELKVTQKQMAQGMNMKLSTYQRAECDAKFSNWTRYLVTQYLKEPYVPAS